MPLGDESVEEFRSLYEQEFGETMSQEDAAIRAREIVVLYEKLYEGAEWDAVTPPEEEDLRETSA